MCVYVCVISDRRGERDSKGEIGRKKFLLVVDRKRERECVCVRERERKRLRVMENIFRPERMEVFIKRFE